MADPLTACPQLLVPQSPPMAQPHWGRFLGPMLPFTIRASAHSALAIAAMGETTAQKPHWVRVKRAATHQGTP